MNSRNENYFWSNMPLQNGHQQYNGNITDPQTIAHLSTDNALYNNDLTINYSNANQTQNLSVSHSNYQHVPSVPFQPEAMIQQNLTTSTNYPSHLIPQFSKSDTSESSLNSNINCFIPQNAYFFRSQSHGEQPPFYSSILPPSVSQTSTESMNQLNGSFHSLSLNAGTGHASISSNISPYQSDYLYVNSSQGDTGSQPLNPSDIPLDRSMNFKSSTVSLPQFPTNTLLHSSINGSTRKVDNQSLTPSLSYQEKSTKPIDKRSNLSLPSYPLKDNGVPPTLSGFNANSVTPSKRMINVSEERSLIPPSGITVPIPDLSHLTKRNNCHPNIMRCTLNAVPCSEDILNKTRLPFALLIHPFRDMSSLQIIKSKMIQRCRSASCRAYINPFVVFTDHRRWKCNLCLKINEMSDDYLFNESTGAYVDPHKRHETKLATIEYIAPKEYSGKLSQGVTYVFLIDISQNAIGPALYSSTISRIIQTISDLLDRLPGNDRGRMAIIGYDANIHFYCLNERGSKEIVVCELSPSVEIPIVSGIFVDLYKTSKEQIRESLLSDLLQNISESEYDGQGPAHSCLGSALSLAKALIGNTGGRITVFNASCPTIGDGVLLPRDVKKQSKIFPLTPDKEFYKSLSLEFSELQIAVDLFQLGRLPCDLASLSVVTRYCGGSVFYYPDLSMSGSNQSLVNGRHNIQFDTRASIELQRLTTDLSRYLTRKIGFDAILRIRHSFGLTIPASFGNFFARASDLFSFANISPDSGIAVKLSIDDSIVDSSVVFLQAALLYTSSSGEKRIRVHTLCLPVTSHIDDVFRMADQQAVAAFLCKTVSERVQLTGDVAAAREGLINAVVDPSVAFGNFCLTSAQKMISLPFPYHLRLLPLFIWGILQSPCLRPVCNDPDSSVAVLTSWRHMPLTDIIAIIHPFLYDVSSVATLSSSQQQRLASMLERSRGAAVHGSKESCCSVDDTCSNAEGGGDNSSDTDASSWDGRSGISCYDEDAIAENGDKDDDNDGTTATDLWYPTQLHLTEQSLTRSGVYVMETGRGIIVLLGSEPPPEFLRQIFGVQKLSELPNDYLSVLPELDNMASIHLRIFLRGLQLERSIGSTLFVVTCPSQSPLTSVFQSHLIEDDKADTSYHRFLQFIHKKVTNS